MTFDPTSIGKAHSNLPPRIVLSGEPKAGKTTWAAKAPNPIIIPIVGEEGSRDLRNLDGSTIEVPATPTITTHRDLLEVLDWLYVGKHDYKTVVIDSLSSLDRMETKEILDGDSAKSKSLNEVGGGFGKGSGQLEMRQRLVAQALTKVNESRNMLVICTAHVRHRDVVDAETLKEYEAFELALNNKTIEVYEQWSDFMLFASKGYYIGEDGHATSKKHKLIIHGKAHLPVGGRGLASKLPAEIDLDFGAFSEAMKKAKATNKGE